MKAFKTYWLLVIVFIGFSNDILAQKSTETNAIRGVWLTNVASNALYSNENIKATIQTCKKSGINTIFVVVWNKGLTIYPSAIMQKEFGTLIDPEFKGRDPLKELITEAKKENIKVHAWFEFGFTSAYGEFGKNILEKYPEWAAINKEGKPVVKNQFHWMNGFLPDVQHFIQSLMIEVVKNYDIDGVQGDDRLPACPTEAGYDAYTTNLYKKEFGKNPPLNTKDSLWVEWRTNLLTSFQKDLYTSIKKIKPHILVTTAPNIYPWAKEEYLQDWPKWINNECTDLVFVQLYRYQLDAYENILNEMVKQAGSNLSKVYPGLLISLGDGYKVSDSLLKQFIQANRKKGIHGEVFFYYEGIRQHEPFFTKEYSSLH